MGWTFYHKPKGIKAVDSIIAGCGAEFAKRIVASSATREAVFLVAEFHEPDSDVYIPDADGNIRALLVYAIKSVPKDHYNFGYKDMEEGMGPFGCPAPLSIIAQCSELKELIGNPEYSSLKSAIQYRAESHRHAAHKALKRSLKPGNKVVLPEPRLFNGIACQRFTVEVCRVRGRKGKSTVFRAENGMLCGLSADNLAGAEVVT